MLFIKPSFIITLLSFLLISGCSSRHDMKITEVFRSHISSENAKLFTFSIVVVGRTDSNSMISNNSNLDEEQKTTRKGKGQGQGRKNSMGNKPNKQRAGKTESRQDIINSEIELRLAKKIEDNNYCRKGFFELDRSYSETIFTIKGECNESATAADRDNFTQVK